MHEGRRAGRKPFDIAGDIGIEWGLLCTGNGDAEELSEMYVFQCRQACDCHPGGFEKLIWPGIVKEFNFEARITVASLTSRKPTRENTGLFGAPTVFETSVSYVFSW